MPVSVKVNGTVNSVVHKGSNGVSTATVPDVCKTPSPGGPVPMPYPNISQSATLDKGTTTVKADGGMMIAIKGSEFSMSSGDEAGTAGGVKSSTFMKESTWILYSFDVKMDGQNACRLTDKKFQNHENTADMGGEFQDPLDVPELEELLCEIWKDCDQSVDEKHGSAKASAAECWDRTGNKEPLAFQISREKHQCCRDKLEDLKPKAKNGVLPALETEKSVGLPGGGGVRLDVVVGEPHNKVYDFKFQCPKSKKAPKWPLYLSPRPGRDGKLKQPKGSRRAPSPAYNNRTQDKLIQDATGKTPEMINENKSPCKKS